jgi:hypothetical protein
MHRSTGWTFYGREGCDCCATAASFLMGVIHGTRLTLRMEDVPPHHRDDAHAGLPRSIPAFVDPAGKVVWQGSFDSEATRMALEVWGVAPLEGRAHDLHAAA